MAYSGSLAAVRVSVSSHFPNVAPEDGAEQQQLTDSDVDGEAGQVEAERRQVAVRVEVEQGWNILLPAAVEPVGDSEALERSGAPS